MTIFTFLLLAFFSSTPSEFFHGTLDGSDGFFEHSDSFLGKYVANGRVDYGSIDKAQLANLLEEIATYPIASVSKDEQLAFYLNAYNLLTINNVLQHAPISSPMDVPGFFDTIKHTVAGQQLTLNGIENDVVRPTFNDARIHFAMVCAAVGCPPLDSKAFFPQTVNAQLDKRTRFALNSQSFLQVQNNEQQVGVSQIFKWYVEDFGGTLESVKGFVNKYLNNPIPSHFEWSHYEYDWTLNAR